MVGRSERSISIRRTGIREPQAPDVPADLAVATRPEADLYDGVVHAGLAADDLDLSGREAAQAEFDQCRYRNVSFAGVRLHRSVIKDVEFSRCDLANLRARESSIRRVSVSAT